MRITIDTKTDAADWPDIKAMIDGYMGYESGPAVPNEQPVPTDDDDGEPSADVPKEYRAASGQQFEETDVEGVRWDARIHSAGQKKNQDGTWRRKRGVADDLVHQVMNEQQAAMDTAAPPPPPAAPAEPAPAPTPPAPAAAPAPATNGTMTFPAFAKEVSGMVQANQIGMSTVVKVLNEWGIPSFPAAKDHPELMEPALEAIRAEAKS